MIVYTRGKIEYLLRIDFIRFCIVGGTGFVINFVLLTLLRHVLHVPLFIAQLIGAEVALFSNFVLHDNWTYKHKKVKKSTKTMLMQFHATSWPAIVGSAVMVSVGVKLLHQSNLVALMVSSLVALLWNFGWSKFVIWRGITETEIERIAE